MTPQELIEMTNTPAKCEQLLIEAVRYVANDRYEQGWDCVVDNWLDGDILEILSEAQFNLPQAIKNIQSLIDIRVRFTQSN